jgi:hypothetical protein
LRGPYKQYLIFEVQRENSLALFYTNIFAMNQLEIVIEMILYNDTTTTTTTTKPREMKPNRKT